MGIPRSFQLHIRESQAGLVVAATVEGPAGHGPRSRTAPFLLDVEAEDLTEIVDVVRQRQADARLLRSLGSRLFDALFPEDIKSLFDISLGESSDEGGLRVVLKIDPPQLQVLPWEYLYGDVDGEMTFLALHRQTLVVRDLEVRVRGNPPIQPPLKILLVASLPDHIPELNALAELGSIQEALRPHIEAGRIEVEPMLRATWSELQNKTRKGVHVLHYIGHGLNLAQGFLVLEDEQKRPQLVGASNLASLIRSRNSLRLVLLNACDTAAIPLTKPYLGLAPALARTGIPAVIGMQTLVGDSSAIDFARAFYNSLAAFEPVDVCMMEGRLAMLNQESDGAEWGTPVLFLHAPGADIFPKESQTALSDFAPPTRLGMVSAMLLGLSIAALFALAGVLLRLNIFITSLLALFMPVVLTMLGIVRWLLDKLDFESVYSGYMRSALATIWSGLQRRRIWQAMALAVTLMTVILWLTLGVPTVQSSMETALPPTPIPVPVKADPEGIYIAIANFGKYTDSGEIQGSSEGSALSDWITDELNEEYRALNLAVPPQIEHNRIGLIRNEDEADRLIQVSQADLVIYGVVLESGGVLTFNPMFYLGHTSVAGDEFLRGQHNPELMFEFDSPLTYSKYESEIQGRLAPHTELLRQFTLGLLYYLKDDPEQAIPHLERAIALARQGTDTGHPEVIELFHAQMLLRRYSMEHDPSDLNTARSEMLAAERSRQVAGRARIVLGNTYYVEAANSDHDIALYDQALATYEKARTTPPVSIDAHIEQKALIGIGNVHFVKAQLLARDPSLSPDLSPEILFQEASAAYRQVTDQFERGDDQLESIAAEAYLGLGFVAKHGDQPGWAARYFQHAIDHTLREEVKKQANMELTQICQNELRSQPLRVIDNLRWCRDID